MHSPADAAPSHLWVPELASSGGVVELSREESHYLKRVCRARVGDLASATDGRGALARLRVAAMGERVRAEVESLEPGAPDEARRRSLVLCGAPEGRRADWLVEKLAELGVEVWQPLDCARDRWRASPAMLGRWRRLAVAALRQSRRRHLMEVREPIGLGALASALPAGSSRWVADPLGRRGVEPPGGSGWVVGAVGPAGGFEAREKSALHGHGFGPICLSDGRLRAETAALAWGAWWAMGGA
jgi:16S rRNA (uracil1498-N3)-methyltransferase